MNEGQKGLAVYLSHRTAFVDYATRLLGSRESAEDVVQEAFLRFAPDKPRAPSEQALPYFYRIVRNLSFDLLKRRKVEQRLDVGTAPFWTRPESAPTPEEDLVIAEQLRIVREVLATLPETTRIAVEMHRFGDYTLAEVSAHLRVPLPTIHRNIRAAMLAIMQRLEDETNDMG